MPDYQSENQTDRLLCYSSKRALWLYQQYRLWGYALILNYISCPMYTSFFVTVVAAPAIL